MSDREFVVIASRLVWGESVEEASHQATLKRLKALLEEREQLLAMLEERGEALGSGQGQQAFPNPSGTSEGTP